MMRTERPLAARTRVEVCQFDGVDVLRTLPLAAGMLVAAARADATLRGAFDFSIHTGRQPPPAVAQRLAGARIVAFSGYTWNWQLSRAVARSVSALDAGAFIVLGGPCVPRRLESARAFLAAHTYVDALVLGEGEIPFRALLTSLLADGPLAGVPSLVFRTADGGILATDVAPRLRDFTGLGSPYLDGTFDALLGQAQQSASRQETLLAAVIETNRGCPFTCTFCDWGQAVHTRVHELPLERVHAEFEWIARHGVQYVYIADANFGIRPRDLGIVQHLGGLRRRYDAPSFCYFHLTKNATARNLATVGALHAAGIGCQVVISMQDTDERVLAAIRRSNIPPARALALRRACNDEGVPTLNELLLGLPGQTLASLRTTLTGAVSSFPGDSFFVYLVRVLENSELGSPDQRAQHGLVTRAVVTAHDGIDETEDVVVATRTLPPADWRRAWRFAQVLSAAYNLRLLHLLVHHIRFTEGEDLAAFVDHLLGALRSAEPGSVFAALDGVLERHVDAIESASAMALPVPGYGPLLRNADEAFVLTALAHGESFWGEVRSITNRWRRLDEERAELLEYQRFVTTGRGDAVAERTFDRDWPAWDATRGRASGGASPRPIRVRRLPPAFASADAVTFAAGWLHAAYSKSHATTIVAIQEATAG
jgi:hypothetical protein